MIESRAARLRRVFFCVAAAAAVWGTIAWMTGGVSFAAGPVRISSRNPRNPFILAALGVALAWALGPAGGRMEALGSEWRWGLAMLRAAAARTWNAWIRAERAVSRVPAHAAPLLTLVIAVLVVLTGFRYGAFVAGASDASGYVSHAELWATRTLRIEPPLMRELTREIPAGAFAPLAYRTGLDGISIVPVTAPGLPLVMAMFHTVIGPHAVYWVVPITAGLAIIAAYLLGATFGGWTGVVAALLLAVSPSFLFQLTSSPMSDIPAAMWWTLSLAFVMRPGRLPALVAGLCAGGAVLTRPNLVPLAVIPALWIAREMWQERTATGTAAQRFAGYAAGMLPACLGIAVLFNFWYGSPFNSGYGSLDEIYAWRHLSANLARYPRWFLESQSPIVVLAALAPFLVRSARAWMLLAFAVAVFACYALYMPFEAWWFIRFLLPAYPPLLVLTAAALVMSAARLLPAVRVSTVLVALALVTSHCLSFARVANAFNVLGEWKYEEAGVYVADHVPERAAVLASQHSGSVRFYARRLTLFFDQIPGNRLDWVVGELQRRGYDAYLLLEDWEEDKYRTLFRGEQAASLPSRPVAELTGGDVPIYRVRLYQLMHNVSIDASRR